MAFLGAFHGIGSLLVLALGLVILGRPKTRHARHPQLGRSYARLGVPILVVGFVVGLRHWPDLSPFQLVVPPTIAATLVGWWAATQSGRRWLGSAWIRVHISASAGSVVVWVTGLGFQIAGRAGVPIDSPMITTVLFAVPTLVASPMIAAAARRHTALRAGSRDALVGAR